MSMQASDIQDLINSSLSELGRLKLTDLMSDYQETVALKRILRQKKVEFGSGPTVRFNLIYDTNDSARFVGLGYTAVSDIKNVLTYGEVPWRHATFNWSLEAREPVMNSGASKIVDIIQSRRLAAMGAWVKLLERQLWRVPTVGSDEMYGIPYYVVKSSTAATFANNDGFNGGHPSGYSSVAGLSSTSGVVANRWKNYTDTFTALTKDDFVRKLRRSGVKTHFMPLVDDVPVYNLGDDFGHYTNYAVESALEEILEDQNENLGTDIASMDGKVLFRRAPVTYVPELENDTTNPIYSLNWGELFAMRLRGWWMEETRITQNPNQPTMYTTHVDSSFNIICRNRRRQSVLATGTTMPS